MVDVTSILFFTILYKLVWFSLKYDFKMAIALANDTFALLNFILSKYAKAKLLSMNAKAIDSVSLKYNINFEYPWYETIYS